MNGDFFYDLSVKVLGATNTSITEFIKDSMKSMSIKEEDGKITTCSINLQTDFNPLFDTFVEGTTCIVTLGYKVSLAIGEYFLKVRPYNPFQFSRSWEFEFGLPNLTYNSDGTVSYNFRLHGSEIELGLDKKTKIWSNTSAALIVQEIVAKSSNINTAITTFKNITKTYIGDDFELQNFESDFAFLTRMAKKWGARMKFTPSLLGGVDLVMSDQEDYTIPLHYNLQWGGLFRSLKSLNFNSPQRKAPGGLVITPGDSLKDFKATETTPDGLIINYRLNEKKLTEDMNIGKASRELIFSQIMKAKSVSDPAVKKYWIKLEPQVVPEKSSDDKSKGQGGSQRGENGFRANIELSYGDPVLSNFDTVEITGDSLSPRLHGVWHVSRVVHKVDKHFSTSCSIYR